MVIPEKKDTYETQIKTTLFNDVILVSNINLMCKFGQKHGA